MGNVLMHFFRKSLPENESNWWEVWLARAGLGAVALSSKQRPVLAPLSLKATPPPALYLVHTTQLPLACQPRAAPPQMRRSPPQMHPVATRLIPSPARCPSQAARLS